MWDSDSLETICIIGVDYFEDAVFALAFSNKVSKFVFALVDLISDFKMEPAYHQYTNHAGGNLVHHNTITFDVVGEGPATKYILT